MRTRRFWPVRLIIMVMMVLALATTSFAVLADDPTEVSGTKMIECPDCGLTGGCSVCLGTDAECEACGGTFVCPTCQCFDIRDFKTKEGVIRYRCWDSCMYSDFTLMAAANSRTTQLQRYRQRFMHKLVYYPAQHEGLYSCVGCGRCVNKCPQRLNIVKVIKTLGGKAHD